MVALEARQRSLLVPSMLALPPSPMAERRKRKQADEIIGYLGLGRYADTLMVELSTGTRRIVELGALLALDARLILLDEPTAGVAQKETETFGPLIKTIQRELGFVDPHRRARHADGDVDQRPHLLPRGGPGDRGGHARRRCATTRASSARTSAPTSERSSGRTAPQCTRGTGDGQRRAAWLTRESSVLRASVARCADS